AALLGFLLRALRVEVPANRLVAAAAGIPLALVGARALLGFAATLVVETADLLGLDLLAAALDLVLAQVLLVGTFDPRRLALARVAMGHIRRLDEPRVIARRIVRPDVRREDVRRRDEAPLVIRDVRVVGVAERRPADGAFTLTPLDPCRAPGGVRTPDPAI